MNRIVLSLSVLLLLFSCCKSNENAYKTAYEKMKEKEVETFKQEQADMIGDSSIIKRKDTGALKLHESVTVVLGDASKLSTYNIVIKSFVNRTNARSLYERMKEEGWPAVLVQNKDMKYRIVVESCKYEFDAEKMLKTIKQSWPESWILVRY